MPTLRRGYRTVLCYRGSRKREKQNLGSIFIVAGTNYRRRDVGNAAGSGWRWFQRHAGIADWPVGADVLYRATITGGISTCSGGIPGWARWQNAILDVTASGFTGFSMMFLRRARTAAAISEPENYWHPVLITGLAPRNRPPPEYCCSPLLPVGGVGTSLDTL